MNDKQRYIQTFSGIKIQIILWVGSILSACAYAYFNTIIIADELIVFMLRAFTIFADLGIFLAIAYLVDFKRGVAIGYIYKIIVFLSIDENKLTPFDFVLKVAGLPFALVLYYKLTLFLILLSASYIIQIDYEEKAFKKLQQEQQKKLLSQEQKQLKKIPQVPQSRTASQSQTDQTVQRIKKSLRYHTQEQFYKKLQIFYFIIYHSTCILVLFPIQEYVIDFTKALQYGQKIDFFKNLWNLNILNEKMVWYINMHTILNVVSFWVIILFGEFRIKKKHPELIRNYVLQIPLKFVFLQICSLIVLCTMLVLTPISVQNQQLQNISLSKLINYQIFGVAYLMHTFLPLLVSFLLIRLYLGQISYLNRLVSKNFSFHKNQQDYDNLDCLFYDAIIQNDINKVRNFKMSKKQLIPRHKLKRYVEQEKLRHYVDQNTVLEIQSLFQDLMVLDLYNKLSRCIVVFLFYISLAIFLVAMNVNDTYITNEDKFFKHVPAILLILMLFFITKYQSSVNVFYPKIIVICYNRISNFLVQRKAFNVVRLTHFYSIIFTIWLYRIYSELFLPTHISLEESIKETLYNFYSSPSLAKNDIISSLLSGWSRYFHARSEQCDYNLVSLLVDSVMLILLISQVMLLKYFHTKNGSKWDSTLMILKVIAPIYAFFIFVINMECLQWSRTLFCIFICLGIAFMHNNQVQFQRGVKRDEQGNYQRR